MDLTNFQEKYEEAVKFFPGLIKNRRRFYGFSLNEAAKDLAISPTHLYKWEEGQTLPSLSHLIDICEYYFISFDMLFRIGEYRDERLEDLFYIHSEEELASV